MVESVETASSDSCWGVWRTSDTDAMPQQIETSYEERNILMYCI